MADQQGPSAVISWWIVTSISSIGVIPISSIWFASLPEEPRKIVRVLSVAVAQREVPARELG